MKVIKPGIYVFFTKKPIVKVPNIKASEKLGNISYFYYVQEIFWSVHDMAKYQHLHDNLKSFCLQCETLNQNLKTALFESTSVMFLYKPCRCTL